VAARKTKVFRAPVPAPALLKLDFGCGPHPREGFEGVDSRSFDGKVTHVLDLAAPADDAHLQFGMRFMRWPWGNESVAEAHASHFIEHLTGPQRIHFVNELYRVLVDGGTCQIIVPHWASCRAYGDLTHQWPPVSEFWFYYLSDEWRAANAPHNDGYHCNFAATWGYALRQDLLARNAETQQFAISNYKEAAQDIVATLTKVPRWVAPTT